MNTRDWENANAEQRNLWHIAQTLIVYTTITPVFFEGVITGSEFLTYNAGKVYLCLDFNYGWHGPTSVVCDRIDFYNMANVANRMILAGCPYWDTTAAVPKWTGNMIDIKNFWFSRILTLYDGYLFFNGYRLNV